MRQDPHPPSARPWWQRLRRAGRARAARQDAAYRLYTAVVNQARTAEHFNRLGVPDTPEGRFEMIALHAALVHRRLRAEGEPGRALGQTLFELMVADFDANLRELGVGDLSVGRYVKRLVQNFYARLEVLDRALDAGDPRLLHPMLERNTYLGGVAPRPEQVAMLARRVVATDARLRALPGDDLLRGQVAFAGAGGDDRGAGRAL